MTDYMLYGKVEGIKDEMGKNGKTLKDIANSLKKIANSLAEQRSPNVFNVYVTTSGSETTRDVAAAVQDAIKRAQS
jgi:DNA anti-recombination protein RmuC